jgi:hypothetical protein
VVAGIRADIYTANVRCTNFVNSQMSEIAQIFEETANPC